MPVISPERLLRLVFLLGGVLAEADCSRPQRPTGIDSAAVWVEGGKTGFWQVCVADNPGGIHCTIWNQLGAVLEDEPFLSVDGAPVRVADLKIREGGPCTGPYQVCLADGRILVPHSRYAEMKAFLERRKP